MSSYGSFDSGFGTGSGNLGNPNLANAEANIDNLSSMVSRLNHMNLLINTASDSPKFREEMSNVRKSARALIPQIAALLEFSPNAQEEREHKRIISKFGEVVSQCKDAINIGVQKENSFPTRDATSQQYGAEVSQRMKQYDQSYDQITIVENASVQVENQIIRDTNAGIHDVHDKLSHLHEISVDTAAIVESQQSMFDHAEKASSASAARSKQAVSHLETGMKLQSRSRRKQCVIIIAILAAVIIVAFIIALFVGLTKGLF